MIPRAFSDDVQIFLRQLWKPRMKLMKFLLLAAITYLGASDPVLVALPKLQELTDCQIDGAILRQKSMTPKDGAKVIVKFKAWCQPINDDWITELKEYKATALSPRAAPTLPIIAIYLDHQSEIDFLMATSVA